MNTAATVKGSDGSHWYHQSGEPCYEIAKKDGSGMRPTTLADARKLNLVPSFTTVNKIRFRAELEEWIRAQYCLAVLTTPKLDNENLDAFVYRVLHTEKVQDQESKAAMERGTELHDGAEKLCLGQEVLPETSAWIKPAVDAVRTYGKVVAVETCLAADGYGGRVDLVLESDDCFWIFDWKTTRKLPSKGAWSDHVLQGSAYAHLWERVANYKPIRTGNCYISTIDQGAFVIFEHDPDWGLAYENGFAPLLRHWCWANKYWPKQDVADQQTPAAIEQETKCQT